jgi:rhodanese-related sulfurtransferase
MDRTYHDLVADAKGRIVEITPSDVMALQRSGEPLKVIDVRDANESNLGTIPGAVQLSRGNLEKLIEGTAKRDETIVLFCSTGSRSALAAASLAEMGYTRVSSMSGGIRGWMEQGGDIE